MRRMRSLAMAVAVMVVAFGAPALGKPTPAQKCAAAKLKAAANKLAPKLACHQKALAHGATVSGTCLAHATSVFTVAFAKAESKGGCIVTSDAAAVEA